MGRRGQRGAGRVPAEETPAAELCGRTIGAVGPVIKSKIITFAVRRLLQKATGSQDCSQSCFDFAEWMKHKALRVRTEGSVPTYVTEAESR